MGVLINLSNHPYDDWSEIQKRAALAEYDAVEDLAFPVVDPEDGIEQVKELAARYSAMLLDIRERRKSGIGVFLAGEATFVCQLVPMLRQNGIRVFTATTRRDTDVHPDGSKTVKFHFRRFREYYPRENNPAEPGC